MKKSILILIISIITNITFAQKEYECEYKYKTYRVISKNGIIIRKQPNRNSERLSSISYWAKIKACETKIKTDTINSIEGHWLKVKNNNIEGYVFDGFIIKAYELILKKKDFRILQEGITCNIPNFDPNLNWYGIYRNGDIDTLIAVTVTLRKVKIGENTEIPDGDYIIETNIKNKQSMFLIGSKEILNEKIAFWNNKVKHKTDFLYPGEVFRLYVNYELNATGIVESNEDIWKKFNDYHILLSKRENGYYKSQDLTKDITYWGEPCSLKLKWCGEIDNDKKPDFIFETGSSKMWSFYLFLSSKAENNKFIKKVDEINIGSCY